MFHAEDLVNGTVVLAKIDMWSDKWFFCHKGYYYRISHADSTYYFFEAAHFRIRKELLFEVFELAAAHSTYPAFDDPAVRMAEIEEERQNTVRKHPFRIIRHVPTNVPLKTDRCPTKIAASL